MTCKLQPNKVELLDRGSFLDNGNIVLIPVLALRELTIELNLASKKVTTKYSHPCDSAQIKSAHAHTDTQSMTKQKIKKEHLNGAAIVIIDIVLQVQSMLQASSCA
jgi:hypothetical protein